MDAAIGFPLAMGDTALILAQRNCEWCGHAPALEEDIATANIALDLLGQARLWLELAGEREGKGRSADDLAYRRDVWDFRNFLLVERPNGDYGQTIMRQFLFDAWHKPMLAALAGSTDGRIAEIARKAVKEASYHLDRSRDLVVRLGGGTTESRTRMQAALDAHWPYVGEMFEADAAREELARQGVVPPPPSLKPAWDTLTGSAFAEAGLVVPKSASARSGARAGRHTEHLGHMLAEMQFLQRAYPGATW